MLFGSDGIDTEENEKEEEIKNFISKIDPKYRHAEIRVWRQSRICGLLRRFPAVSLKVKNLATFQLLTHDQWANRLEMRQEFIVAPDQRQVVNAVRAVLRDDSQGSIHIRVIGEPGIGKTRLILEALRAVLSET